MFWSICILTWSDLVFCWGEEEGSNWDYGANLSDTTQTPTLKNSNNETKQKMVVLRIFKKQFLLWYEFHGALKRTNPACFETINECLLLSLKYTFIIKFSYHHQFWKCWINENFYFLKEAMDEEVPWTGLLISKSKITKSKRSLYIFFINLSVGSFSLGDTTCEQLAWWHFFTFCLIIYVKTVLSLSKAWWMEI